MKQTLRDLLLFFCARLANREYLSQPVYFGGD